MRIRGVEMMRAGVPEVDAFLDRSLSRWHVTSRQLLGRWRLRCLSDVVDYLCRLLHLGTGRRPERFAPVRHRGRLHPEVRRAMPHHRSFPQTTNWQRSWRLCPRHFRSSDGRRSKMCLRDCSHSLGLRTKVHL